MHSLRKWALWAVLMALLVSGCGEGGGSDQVLAEDPALTPAVETPRATPGKKTRSPMTAPPSTPAAAPAATREPAPMALEVGVFDDTESNPPGDRFELWVRGSGSWFPDLSFGGDGPKVLGSYPSGHKVELFIYPDGRDGREIAVVFTMSDEVPSGSDAGRTMISVSDQQIKVVSIHLPGRSQTFPR